MGFVHNVRTRRKWIAPATNSLEGLSSLTLRIIHISPSHIDKLKRCLHLKESLIYILRETLLNLEPVNAMKGFQRRIFSLNLPRLIFLNLCIGISILTSLTNAQ